jgi:hypothetical protein
MSDVLEKIKNHLETDPLANGLTPLFCQTLRWGAPQGMRPRSLTVGPPIDGRLTALPVAQLTGLPVFHIEWPHDWPNTFPRKATGSFYTPRVVVDWMEEQWATITSAALTPASLSI